MWWLWVLGVLGTWGVTSSTLSDTCITQYGGIELVYPKGANQSYTFDLCAAIKCGGSNASWRGYDVYICGFGYGGGTWCRSWNHVLQATNRDFTPGNTRTTDGKLKLAGHLSLQRDVPPDWCNETRNGSEIGMWARGGLYFYCGRQQLWVVVPAGASGRCAMVRLTSPVLLLGTHLNHTKTWPRGTSRRRRRDTQNQFDLTYGSPTYIDAMGIPRGVPNEYKLADQIAAGFENIPVIAALFPITPNKNVDRINFVHYNVLRLANMTRDAVEGLAEQLAPTSLMAVQNRMALDMLLAEKGGVCAMFGEMCCTFIPNNTAPDGKVTRALDGLRALSKEMHEASGVDNPITDWMANVFGKWKDLVMSILISLATFVAVLVTCGCFCVPCIRSLCVRCITSTIESKAPGNPPPYQMPLLGTAPPAEDEEEEFGPQGIGWQMDSV